MAFVTPVVGTLTQDFGCTGFGLEPAATWHGVYCSHFHGGIDLAAPTGTPVWAAASGYVREQGWDISIAQGGGISVWVQHSNYLHTVYVHLSESLVVANQMVVGGQQIAKVGATGNVTGPHLHFAVWTNTAQWGFSVDDPKLWMVGGANANETINNMADIPWLEPYAGTFVRGGLCLPQQNGSYALPTSATRIIGIYFDSVPVQIDQYTVTTSAGNIFITPLATLPPGVEVRADYVV